MAAEEEAGRKPAKVCAEDSEISDDGETGAKRARRTRAAACARRQYCARARAQRGGDRGAWRVVGEDEAGERPATTLCLV